MLPFAALSQPRPSGSLNLALARWRMAMPKGDCVTQSVAQRLADPEQAWHALGRANGIAALQRAVRLTGCAAPTIWLPAGLHLSEHPGALP